MLTSGKGRSGTGIPGLSAMPVRLLAAGIAIIDLSIATRWAAGRLGPLEAIADHLLVSAALCLLVGLLQRRASPHLMVLAALLLLLGPVGGLALLVAGLHVETLDPGATSRGILPENDAADDARARPADLVCATIAQGRRPSGSSERMDSFEQTFAAGDAPRQQRALGMISRSYRPEMLPALRLALASPRPAVKVQASAVYAKLRSRFADRAKLLLGTPAPGLSATASRPLVDECRAVARSGFVDPAIAQRLLAHADAMQTRDGTPDTTDGRAEAHHTDPAASAQPADPARLRLNRYSCGGIA